MSGIFGIGFGLPFGGSPPAIEITPNWDLYVSSNDGVPLNTANALSGTTSPVSTLTFDDLTGITITSQSGTGTWAISGNNIICTSAGTLYNLVLSDGDEILFSEGIGDYVYSKNGVKALITDASWLTGQASGSQTSLIKRNTYIYYNGTNPRVLNIASPIANTVYELDLLMPKYYSGFDYYFNYYNATEGRGLAISVNAGKWRFFLNDGTTTLQFYQPTTNWVGGERYVLRMEVNADASDMNCYINNVLVTTKQSNSAFNNQAQIYPVLMGSAGSTATGAIGVVFNWSIAGVDYNDNNNYQGLLKDPFNVTGDKNISFAGGELTDSLGDSYLTDVSKTGFDFTGQVAHHYDTGIIIDQSGHSAIGVWAEQKNRIKNKSQLIAKNDLFQLLFTDLGFIRFEFNGGVIATSNSFTHGKKYYIGVYMNGSGTWQIYVGDEDTEMVLEPTTGVTANGAVSSSSVIIGEDVSFPIFGKVEQFNHHPLPYTVTEFENDRLATKKKIIEENNGFPYTFPFTLS